MAKPQIRLKGFRDEWDSLPFSDIVDRVSTSGVSDSATPAVEFEDIISGEGLLNKDVTKKGIKKSGIAFSIGDILFGKLRPYLKNILLSDFNGIAVGDFWILRPRQVNPYLLYNLVGSRHFMQVANISSGSKMPRADWQLVSGTKFNIPHNTSEQEGIAAYFLSLDELIKASVQKIDSLKQMKSASLQFMFPKPGETRPRVRFNGFNDDWEIKTLNKCLEISNEKNIDNNYRIEDVLSVSDDYGVINQIQLLGRSYAGKSVSNYGLLKAGEIVYTKSPLSSKPFGIIKQNFGDTGIVSVLYAIYRPKNGVSAEFIHYYFDPAWRLNNYLRPLVRKGAKNTMNISDETALTGTITIPNSFQEQRQIASYFRELDAQIRLHEQKLEKLKQIKASCLDKMFV